MLKKEKFSIPLFISVSVFALLFLFVFYNFSSFFKRLFTGDLTANGGIDKVYIDDSFNNGDSDPFVTKRANLKDILAGPIITRNDPSFGPIEAPVTLVFFSDFQCGICRQQEEILWQAMEKYSGKTRLIWKDYSDKNRNSVSFQASLAGRCANEQNKFREYRSLLFADDKQPDRNIFIKLAETLDMNKDKFKDCLDNLKYQREINDNILEANTLDIAGVPFVYVNDQEVLGEIGVETLSKMIEAELAK